MKKLIKELRRREVFRTAGLYVGICWIIIEVASVLLPNLDAPAWLFRGAIIAAIAGFPVMLVLAWFFDVNEEGISLQANRTKPVVENLGAQRKDFVIIGVLALALMVSLSLNIKNDAPIAVNLAPVSVLVADFDSTTNDPVFDNVLEEALVVGIEVAPHITAFERSDAVQIGRQIKPDAKTPGGDLNLEVARQIAQREGIKMLLAGSLQQSGDGYRISVEGIDASNAQSMFKITQKADSRAAVLQAIGKLSHKARKKLGDSTSGDRLDGQAQTFVAASLEAAHAYAMARQFQIAGKLEDAARFYAQATDTDPNFGRAFSSLALVEFTLGQTNEAEAHWAMALTLMNTMTERERLRALGRYTMFVVNDGDKATKIYAELVDKYPADVGARKLYAAASFRQLDFATAIEETRKVLQIYPADYLQRTTAALYAMYAGDWQTATREAERVINVAPEYATAYLPIAMAALARGQVDASREAYNRMALTNKTGHSASIAELGLADIDLYFGEVDAAQKRLSAGIKTDIDSGNERLAALKYIALAQLYTEQQNFPAATTACADALRLADDDAMKVSTAMIYIRVGDLASATAIADTLTTQTDAHSRAYGQMLKGMILAREGAPTKAILAMRAAITTADLWLIRYQIGQAYLLAGNHLQALDELTTLKKRRGEATAIFLDDMPTYRLLAELPYWIARVQEELKLHPAARASYEEFVTLRPQGGALAQDATDRVAKLN